MEQATTALATADHTIIVDELVTDSRFDTLPVLDIRISKTNRKRFNLAALKELAANIKANGLIQPILVRPVEPTEEEPAHYEIVCGERRYRATNIAKLTTINVIIRNLSDTQAAELQLIENLQREDPHPMEEAEGYQALMLHSGYTADMLADKLSKSRSQIYATLKLCNLCKELRDEFFENKEFTRSLALLVARIPVPSLQVEAFEDIMEGHGAEPFSYRDAAEHIQAHYNVHLRTAIFSTTDTFLTPDAGSCKACPKRTGNDPDLADLDKNICTDPKCYQEKVIAHNARIIERAERNNITILIDAEALKAISYANEKRDNYAVNGTRLFHFSRLINNADRNKTVIDAIGSDKLPEPIAVAVVNGVPTSLYNALHVQITLEDLGFCNTEVQAQTKAIEQADKSTANTEGDDDYKPFDDGDENEGTDQESLDRAAANDQINRDADNEEIKRMRIYRTIRNRAPLSIDSLRLFVRDIENAYSHNIPAQYHEELYGQSMENEEDRFAYIDSATSEQLQLLIIDYVVGYSIQKPQYIGWKSQQFTKRADEEFVLLRDIAVCEGIDITTAEQEPASPVQAPATEPTEPEAVAAPAAKKRGRPSKADKAAQEAASKPVPMDKWPFPTTKTVGGS
ncbi:ParB/RepB/Spo0J family partition protein [Undibacterium sp.]|uniref:ParB/RepB/Spo0J family partition protein n=1 Tax=Undibacterium sp. TaxID=1914977 RepID=UPI003752EF5B